MDHFNRLCNRLITLRANLTGRLDSASETASRMSPEENAVPDPEPIIVTPDEQRLIDICTRLMGPDGEAIPHRIVNDKAKKLITTNQCVYTVVRADMGDLGVDVQLTASHGSTSTSFYELHMVIIRVFRVVDGIDVGVLARSFLGLKDRKHPLYRLLIDLYKVMQQRAYDQEEAQLAKLKEGVFDDLERALTHSAGRGGAAPPALANT